MAKTYFNKLVQGNIIVSGPGTDKMLTLAANPQANNRGHSIVIEGQSEKIVGQLAKFPPENEQITEVKATSEVDSNAGRELLSIISKY